MAIPVGTRFGPYEVRELIGAGGMGEVHRARDTRLGRDVAIKTLPPGLGADAARLRRFEIEAKAASLLSHPGILTIYDIGTTDGQPYIVSELLEGENLRERLNRGPLPSFKGIDIAAAVADALAAAHARGIIHRDLKPENVFLTRDGRVKILDFGIAKLTTPEPAEAGGAKTLTLLTDVGVAVGTLGYMAPEQVRGEPVDPRSDIFALGAILYEMLAGAPAFRADSRVQTVNAILESDPPPLPDAAPPAVRQIVNRCLEKQPDLRFQSARDLAFALRTLSDTTAPVRSGRPTAARDQRFAWWTVAAAAALASAITAAALWTLHREPPPATTVVRRFSFQPPAPIAWWGIAVSPDGTRLVYSGGPPNDFRLYVKRSDEFVAKPLAGTEFGRVPFFSPDGQWIAFTASGKLRKIPVDGGTPISVCDVGVMLAGTWAADGTIIISEREHGLMRVSAEGGTLEPLISPNTSAGEIDHHTPDALPGGGLLFTIHAGAEVFRIAVRTPAGEQRVLIDDGFSARYVRSGHIVYGRAEGMFAAPFDLQRLQLTGPPVLVIEDAAQVTGDGIIVFAAAADGTLAYVPAPARNGRLLVWVDRTGKETPLAMPPREYLNPTLSPDGKRFAVQITEGTRHHIWMYDFDTEALARLSPDGTDSVPVWSADGKHVTYTSQQKEERRIMWQPVDASAPPVSLVASRNNLWPSGSTPDGSRLVYVEDPPTSLDRIKAIGLGPNAAPDTIVGSSASQLQPDVSPDGRWIAYVVIEGGGPEIFVRPLAGGTARQITPDGGMQPRWSGTGHEIFYRRVAQFMRIPLQTTPNLAVGKPEKLFDDPYFAMGFGPTDYDVSRDGQRFLMIKPAEAERVPPPINIVTDWFPELVRRVPPPR